jgi:hypothetical protein
MNALKSNNERWVFAINRKAGAGGWLAGWLVPFAVGLRCQCNAPFKASYGILNRAKPPNP